MKKWILYINKTEQVLAATLLAVMSVLVAVQVVFRYGFDSSLTWSEELARYLLIWAVYLGCSYATKQDRHLEVTLLRHWLPPKLSKCIQVLALLLTLAFCILCTWYGVQEVSFLQSTGQRTETLELTPSLYALLSGQSVEGVASSHIPVYFFTLAIPVGIGLMGIRTLLRIWTVIAGPARKPNQAA